MMLPSAFFMRSSAVCTLGAGQALIEAKALADALATAVALHYGVYKSSSAAKSEDLQAS